MAGSWIEHAIEAYRGGCSVTEVASVYNVPVSTAYTHLKKAGVLRSRTAGVRNASAKGKLGGARRGKKVVVSPQHRERLSIARKAWAERHAKGTSIKPNGYVEYTIGPNKFRSVHVVIMEKRLGRKLLADEHVHHIDGDRQNNEESNLALVTIAGHVRLHRREKRLMSRKAKEDK